MAQKFVEKKREFNVRKRKYKIDLPAQVMPDLKAPMNLRQWRTQRKAIEQKLDD